MAKPYREGNQWAIRTRVDSHDLYLCGFETARAAEEAAHEATRLRRLHGSQHHQGPKKTTLAKALLQYGLERLPFKKGARQEAGRLNKYLRAAALPTFVVHEVRRGSNRALPERGPSAAKAVASGGELGMRPDDGVVAHIGLNAPEVERSVPKGLGGHRKKLVTKTSNSDRLRECLAQTNVAELTQGQLQAFFDRMRAEGLSASTLQLERAMLRHFLTYARKTWGWTQPPYNLAAGLELPKVDNVRDRVLSYEEQQRLEEALAECRNDVVRPAVTLMRETAMRASEPLEYACWGDVDWQRRVICLKDAKAGSRDVPLSPSALEALHALKGDGEPDQDARIVSISYESLKAAWRRALERAGIKDLRLHDLRHTAATRMALTTGNVFLVQALTGHKTLSQVTRYVNVKADDVVAVMHAQTTAPAVPTSSHTAAATPQLEPSEPAMEALVQAAVRAAIGAMQGFGTERLNERPSKEVCDDGSSGAKVVSINARRARFA